MIIIQDKVNSCLVKKQLISEQKKILHIHVLNVMMFSEMKILSSILIIMMTFIILMNIIIVSIVIINIWDICQ